MNDLFSYAKEYGTGIVLSIGVFSLLYMIVKWLLDSGSQLITMMDKHNECWRNIISTMNKDITEFKSEVKEAHTRQREEHERLFSVLKK
jgi:hypothetical protein